MRYVAVSPPKPRCRSSFLLAIIGKEVVCKALQPVRDSHSRGRLVADKQTHRG